MFGAFLVWFTSISFYLVFFLAQDDFVRVVLALRFFICSGAFVV